MGGKYSRGKFASFYMPFLISKKFLYREEAQNAETTTNHACEREKPEHMQTFKTQNKKQPHTNINRHTHIYEKLINTCIHICNIHIYTPRKQPLQNPLRGHVDVNSPRTFVRCRLIPMAPMPGQAECTERLNNTTLRFS